MSKMFSSGLVCWCVCMCVCVCFYVCVCVYVYFLSCQRMSCDRPSSDGEPTHENGHSDWKDPGENLLESRELPDPQSRTRTRLLADPASINTFLVSQGKERRAPSRSRRVGPWGGEPARPSPRSSAWARRSHQWTSRRPQRRRTSLPAVRQRRGWSGSTET